MKRTICLLIVVLLLTMSFGAASAEDPWKPDIEFTTVDTEGNEWTDLAFADARLTMVNFWAYWYPPCVGELPDLQKLSEDYPDLQILGVSPKEYEEDNIKTMEKLGITYPTLQLTESIEEVLNSGYIPETMFVDSEGHILGDTFVGSRSYKDWAAIIDEYLEQVPELKEKPEAAAEDTDTGSSTSVKGAA